MSTTIAAPQFKHCLICEDVRQELNRKTALLGVYGLCPDVDILIRDFAVGIERLVFYLFGGKGEGTFTAKFWILDERGSPLVDQVISEIVFRGPTRRHNLAIGVGNIRFPRPGTYVFQLTLNNEPAIATTFNVLQGQETDFAD